MSPAEPAAPVRPSRFGRFFWRDPNTQFLLLAAAAGLCGGMGAIVFRFVTRYLTRLIVGSDLAGWTRYETALWRQAAQLIFMLQSMCRR